MLLIATDGFYSYIAQYRYDWSRSCKAIATRWRKQQICQSQQLAPVWIIKRHRKAVVPWPLSMHGTMGKEWLGMRSLTKIFRFLHSLLKAPHQPQDCLSICQVGGNAKGYPHDAGRLTIALLDHPHCLFLVQLQHRCVVLVRSCVVAKHKYRWMWPQHYASIAILACTASLATITDQLCKAEPNVKWMATPTLMSVADLPPSFWPHHIAMNMTCMFMRVTLNPKP